MKKLIMSFVTMAITTTSFAQVSSSNQFTCLELYEQQAKISKEKRDKYNDLFNSDHSDVTLNAFLALTGAVVAASFFPPAVAAAAFVTPIVIDKIKNTPKKEERALRLTDEYANQVRRFVIRMRKEVSPNVTLQDVADAVKSGFDSGEYCKDISNLHGPVKIRTYVKDQLRAKYPEDLKISLKAALKNESCTNDQES